MTTKKCLNAMAREAGWNVAFCHCKQCEEQRQQAQATIRRAHDDPAFRATVIAEAKKR